MHLTILIIAEFLFGLFIAFQDLSISTSAGNIRISYLFLIFAPFFLDKALIKTVFNKYILNFKNGFLIYILYLFISVLMFPTIRAYGFFVWFLVWIFVLFNSFYYRRNYIFKGMICGNIIGAFHIAIQRFDPFLGVSHHKIFQLIDPRGFVRVFSYFGEPSYALINLSICLLIIQILLLKMEKSPRSNFYLGIYGLLVFSSLYCYSKLVIFTILLSSLYCIYMIYRVEIVRFQACKVLLVLILLLVLHLILPFKIDNNFLQKFSKHDHESNKMALNSQLDFLMKLKGGSSEKVSNIILNKKIQTISMSQRKASLLRTNDAIKENFWLGVGLGNSKKYLLEKQFRSDLPFTQDGVLNLWQEIVLEQGIIGLTLLLFLIFKFTSFFWPLAGGKVFYPMFACLFMLMQFAQNINFPAIWLSLFFIVYMGNKEAIAKNV